jgi:hypothetical protein
MFNPMSLLKVMGLPARQQPQTHQKHPGMVQEETLDCSGVANEESRCESHPEPMARSES